MSAAVAPLTPVGTTGNEDLNQPLRTSQSPIPIFLVLSLTQFVTLLYYHYPTHLACDCIVYDYIITLHYET